MSLSLKNIKKLSEIHLAESQAIWHALIRCTEKTRELSGYMQLASEKLSDAEKKLFQLTELKHSFEMEGYAISFIRLFEAYSSENALKDPVAQAIFRAADTLPAESQQTKDDIISLSSITPRYLDTMLKTQVFGKTHKAGDQPYRLKPFSNFRLPDDGLLLENLKMDFNQNINRPISFNLLTDACLTHYQIMVMQPFTQFNGHCARVLTNQWYRKQKLCLFGSMPLSFHIGQRREQYHAIIKETLESGNYQPWVIWFLGITEQAAVHYLQMIQSFLVLKKQTEDQVTKYTDYNLPVANIMVILFARPFIKAADIMTLLQCHRQTAYSILLHLVKMGILTEKQSGREKLFFHKKLYDALT